MINRKRAHCTAGLRLEIRDLICREKELSIQVDCQKRRIVALCSQPRGLQFATSPAPSARHKFPCWCPSTVCVPTNRSRRFASCAARDHSTCAAPGATAATRKNPRRFSPLIAKPSSLTPARLCERRVSLWEIFLQRISGNLFSVRQHPPNAPFRHRARVRREAAYSREEFKFHF